VDRTRTDRTLIDVVAIRMVEVAVVQEVDVIVVGDLRVPAPAVMRVGVRWVRLVRPIGRVVEGHGRCHGGMTPTVAQRGRTTA
jgi:hypothetical protein